MSDLTPHAVLQINKVMEIIDLVQTSDVPLKVALAQLDISRATYYRWFMLAQEARDRLQEAKVQLEVIEYADILSAKGQILRKLLEDALNKNTFPSDRLAILQYLDLKTEVFGERFRPSDAGADFLQGPTLKPGISTHRETTISIAGVDIVVKDTTPDIIEGESHDL